MARKKAPELTFQQHIADFLVHAHKCGVLEQSDITDTEHSLRRTLQAAPVARNQRTITDP